MFHVETFDRRCFVCQQISQAVRASTPGKKTWPVEGFQPKLTQALRCCFTNSEGRSSTRENLQSCWRPRFRLKGPLAAIFRAHPLIYCCPPKIVPQRRSALYPNLFQICALRPGPGLLGPTGNSRSNCESITVRRSPVSLFPAPKVAKRQIGPDRSTGQARIRNTRLEL